MNLFQLATSGIDTESLPSSRQQEPAGVAPEPLPVSGRKVAVPAEIDSIIQEAAATYGVDPNVVRGVAFAESGFDPDVISGKRRSSAGAVGLMQFMPQTAKELDIDPLNVREAIFGGAYYLRKNLDKFDGDYGRAVAAYNWGPNRDAFSREDWFTAIPKETDDYVKRVFAVADSFGAEPGAEPEKSQQIPLPNGVAPSAAGGGRGFVNPEIGVNNYQEQKAVKRDEFAPVDEAVRGVKTGVTGLKQLWESNAVLKDATLAANMQERLNAFDRIDAGAKDVPRAIGLAYQQAGPEERKRLRGMVQQELGKRRDFLDASLATLKQYQADMERTKGRVAEFTDIQGVKDFTNWLAFNGGSGVASMAPLILSAATGPLAPAVAGAVGFGMATGEINNDRIDYARKKGMDNKGVADYVADKAGSTVGAAIPFAALDVVAGPVGSMLSTSAKGGVKALERMGVRKAAKEIAKDTAEEFVTGGAQEAIKLATGYGLDETDALLTAENAKKLLNSAAAEAAGGLTGGSGRVAGVATMQAMAPRVEAQPTTPKAPVVPKREPTIDVTYQTADGRTVTDVVPGAPAPVQASTANDAADGQSVDSIAKAILEAESKAAQPAAQPLTGLAAELEALRARNKAATTSTTTETVDAAPVTGVPELGAQAADDSGRSAPAADAVRADAGGRDAGLTGAPAASSAEPGTGSDGGRTDSNAALTQQAIQETANAQAATQTVAEPARPLPAARSSAVEAAGPATIPATTGVASESQASQTQQGNAQPTQAGGPQAGAAPTTASTSPTGGNRVQAAGLTNGTTTQNLGAQATPTAGTQVKPQSKREEVEAEFSSGAGSFAEKLSAKLSDTRYKLMQAESMNPLQQRLSGVDLHAMRAEIARLDGLAVAAKEADAASLTAESSRWILKSARQELDASNLNEQERVQAVQKAQAKGNAADAAQSIFSDVDAAASPQGTAGTQTQENTRIGRDNTPLTDGGQGSPGADGEGLTRYTAEEVTGRQDAVAQAEAATQRAENAAGKAEAAAKQAKEIAQRSVAAADTFELGGNAEDNLSGQGGLQFSKTSKPIAILDGSEVAAEITHDNAVEVAREWYRANLQGDTVIRDGFGEVRFTSKGWGELKLGLRNDALKAKLLPAVRSLIQSGEYHGREELYKQRADSITAFHFFSGKVSVDGKVVTAGVTVGEDAFGNLFYNVTHNESRFWKDRSPLVLPRENAEGPKGLLVDGEPPTKQSMSDDDGNVNLVILDGASSVTPVATIRTALASAYGNLLSRLESKGLVTLTQTQDEAIDAAARARADKTGQPLAEVRASLMGSVSNNGNFDPNDLDIRRSANGAVQGFFDPQTGQSFLIADNLTAESAPGTLMHEVGIHMAADGKLQPLFDRALQLLKLGRNNPFIQRVQSRMDAAGETSGEEAAAYIVTEYENDRAGAPSSVASWVKDFIADVRAWLFSKGVLLKAEQLSMADIAAVARANARSMAQGDAGGLQGVGLVFSRGGNPTPPIPTSAQNGLFDTPPWQLPEATHTDKLIYELQDGRVDLKRVQEAIAATGKTITEGFDARLAETLLPGRVARRTETFLTVEAKPLLESMAKNNVSQDELSDYLLARHAPERNAQVAKVNPDMPDGGAGTNSQGVLMTTQAARDHISALTAGKRTALELLARQVDAITAGTRDILVREGLEKQETIDAWMGAYKHYVPLFKDESMDTMAHPMGSGLSVTGSASRRATGSTGEVTNMLAHVLMQRETAITRAEKNRAAMSLYGLALTNPNAEMWTTIRPSMPADQIADELMRMGVDPMEAEVGMQGVPTIRGVDPVSGKVVDRPNPMYKRLDNALTVKVNGEDRVILFNAENERAMRLVRNLKNQDGVLAHLDLAGSFIGKATRYFASINTQYNPAFGMVNVIRDVGGALVNLSDTALAGKQARVLSDSIPAAIGIARDLRGDAQRTPWSDLWQQFQDDGGRTGYRDLFTDPYKRAEAVQSELDKLSKQGTLTPGAAAHAVLDLLDDFNTTLENGVRLSAYKAALDQGLSRAEAARLARELTLDFNRKGRAGRELGPLFAFFNASVQGTARTLKALQGPAGKRILIGGVGLGVMQALMLAAAGFDDDEIPEFVKARALIIPMPGKQYIAIPLQFGLNALPNTGRVATELLMSGGKDWAEKSFNALGELAGSFNPLGGGNIFTGSGLLKTVAPTVVDPIVDITTNTDFTGKPIGKERMPWDTRPGFAMARESTQRAPTGQAYVGISKAINSLSGGNDFARGLASPSPEEVRYVFTTLGGGVYRELEKVLNASLLTAQGETLKAREVPFGSRFAGEVEDADVQRGRYFKNNAKLEKLEAQLKGLSKEGRGEELRALVKDNPEIQLYELNNQVSAELAKLNKLAAQSINDREALKRIDEVRTQYMRALNDKMRELEKAAKDRAGGDKVPKK